MVRHIGRCIYCRAGPMQSKLSDEHIVPFSLGADRYLKEASCEDCRKITQDFETHLARNVFGHLRIHTGVQTRHPKQRPTELPSRIIRSDEEQRVMLPIEDHPHFLVMPIWEAPNILRGYPPQTLFGGLSAHLYHHVPPTTGAALGLRHAERAEVRPEFRVDVIQFARAIAKIAYCQAVGNFGLGGFRSLVMPDLIRGKYTAVSQFVGSNLELPPPPAERGMQHIVTVYEALINGGLRLLLANVRLFADSGTQDHGMPIYTVIVGAPSRNLT
jgi:hypothetical protein